MKEYRKPMIKKNEPLKIVSGTGGDTNGSSYWY